MFRCKVRSQPIQSLCLSLLFILFSWGLSSCSDRLEASTPLIEPTPKPVITGKLSEVAPPQLIQELQPALEKYHPQVTILSPQPDQILSETTVSVQLQVRDYPLFRDAELDMGPHLHLFVDNQPHQAIYSVDQPIILENLTPGTHILRVFAVRPWDESFKNEGAYAQTTFHIFSKTESNAPNPSLPLLTYNHPQGNYGAEPIMLDFYLTNSPLHVVARDNPDDEIVDWRIRVTINGESFLLDTWQSVYLKGFQPGKNWVQLEFLDEQGNPVDNAFNNTVRLINYEPNGQDTLSKLVRGEISSQVARSLVDPNNKDTLIPEETVLEETPIPEAIQPSEAETPMEEEESEVVTELSPSSETELIPEEPEPPSPSPSPEEALPTVETEAIEESPTPTVETETEVSSEVLSPPAEKETLSPPKAETPEPSAPSPSPTESSLSVIPQWFQNLANSFKAFNFDQITQFFENLKNP